MAAMNQNAQMGDREITQDCLTSQKFCTSAYNTWSGECVTQSLRNDMIALLQEEQNIQFDVFNQMNTRGWYPVKSAEQQNIDELKQQYNV